MEEIRESSLPLPETIETVIAEIEAEYGIDSNNTRSIELEDRLYQICKKYHSHKCEAILPFEEREKLCETLGLIILNSESAEDVIRKFLLEFVNFGSQICEVYKKVRESLLHYLIAIEAMTDRRAVWGDFDEEEKSALLNAVRHFSSSKLRDTNLVPLEIRPYTVSSYQDRYENVF